MQFWKRAESFGFKLPRYTAEHESDRFEGTSCAKLSGNRLLKDLLLQCKTLSETKYASCPKPKLAVILPGQDPASKVYVANKQKRFAEAGFDSELHAIPESDCTQEALENIIDGLNAHPGIHGVLLQLPLPNGIDSTPLLDRILPSKDVDGFHVLNTGCLASGRYDGLLPCTPFGIMALLYAYGISLEGKNVTVIGRSNHVGKPAALMALNDKASVTIVHKASNDVPSFTRNADVLIAAAGVMHLVKADEVKENAVVIDVGIHRKDDGKLTGDVHPDVRKMASAATPVPGGVGPMTIAMLCINTAISCWASSR